MNCGSRFSNAATPRRRPRSRDSGGSRRPRGESLPPAGRASFAPAPAERRSRRATGPRSSARSRAQSRAAPPGAQFLDEPPLYAVCARESTGHVQELSTTGPTRRGRRCVPPPPEMSSEFGSRAGRAGALRRDPDVAAHRELEPASEAETVDPHCTAALSRPSGGEPLDSAREPPSSASSAAREARGLEMSAPATNALTRASEHDRAHAVVGVGRSISGLELLGGAGKRAR